MFCTCTHVSLGNIFCSVETWTSTCFAFAGSNAGGQQETEQTNISAQRAALKNRLQIHQLVTRQHTPRIKLQAPGTRASLQDKAPLPDMFFRFLPSLLTQNNHLCFFNKAAKSEPRIGPFISHLKQKFDILEKKYYLLSGGELDESSIPLS